MALTKAQKQKIVDDLKEKIDRQKAIVFGDITGVKMGGLTKLRKEMKQNGGELKVAKKTLISRALKERGFEIDLKKMAGEIVLGFGYQDEIVPFRTFYNFSKENENLKILGGLMEGELLLQEKAMELAKLPAKAELLAQLFFTAKSQLLGIFDTFRRNLSVLKVKT